MLEQGRSVLVGEEGGPLLSAASIALALFGPRNEGERQSQDNDHPLVSRESVHPELYRKPLLRAFAF